LADFLPELAYFSLLLADFLWLLFALADIELNLADFLLELAHFSLVLADFS